MARTDDEIITTGPRDWPEAKRVKVMLMGSVTRAMMSTQLDEMAHYIGASKRLLGFLPVVAMFQVIEERKAKTEVAPFYIAAGDCSESVKRVLDGTIPKHED
jgi:hypothetical protein